jgi:hypothetical protein
LRRGGCGTLSEEGGELKVVDYLGEPWFDPALLED